MAPETYILCEERLAMNLCISTFNQLFYPPPPSLPGRPGNMGIWYAVIQHSHIGGGNGGGGVGVGVGVLLLPLRPICG